MSLGKSIQTLQSFSQFGPFKTIFKDIEKCNTTKEYPNIVKDTENILHLYRHVTDDGRTLLQGNATLRSSLKQIKLTISAYQNNRKKFTAKNINCHNALGDIVFTAARLPVRGCYLKPGTYYFNNIDLNKAIHKFIRAIHYGPFELKVEVFVDNRSERKEISCIILGGEHVPAEENNNK